MVDHRAVRMVLSLSALLVACGTEQQGLNLEQTCSLPAASGLQLPACTLEGDAQITSGVTGDSMAVRLGPASGALRIRLNAMTAAFSQPKWSLEVLAAARPLRPEGNTLFRNINYGSCDALTCPDEPPDSQAPLGEDFQWARMVDDIAGGRPPPDDAFLTLRGADIDILDLRAPGFTGTTNF